MITTLKKSCLKKSFKSPFLQMWCILNTPTLFKIYILEKKKIHKKKLACATMGKTLSDRLQNGGLHFLRVGAGGLK